MLVAFRCLHKFAERVPSADEILARPNTSGVDDPCRRSALSRHAIDRLTRENEKGVLHSRLSLSNSFYIHNIYFIGKQGLRQHQARYRFRRLREVLFAITDAIERIAGKQR